MTFTATVSASAPGAGTPSGTVTFQDGATTLGTGTLSNGSVSFSSSSLAVGSHTITATYGGDGNFSGSSGTVSQTVNVRPTATSLTSSLNPSTFGQSVTFTATVTSNGSPVYDSIAPVTFRDNGVVVDTEYLVGTGVVTFTTSTLAVGTHALTATYNGDFNYAASTSPTLSQVVNSSGGGMFAPSRRPPDSRGPSLSALASSLGSSTPAPGSALAATTTPRLAALALPLPAFPGLPPAGGAEVKRKAFAPAAPSFSTALLPDKRNSHGTLSTEAADAFFAAWANNDFDGPNLLGPLG